MGVPDNFIAGSIVFLLAAALLSALSCVLRCTGRLTKMNETNLVVFFTVSVSLMWLTWACTLLHQWHPLVSPQIPTEE